MRDISTTLLQTSGEIPTPRAPHGAALFSTTLLICGGSTTHRSDGSVNADSLCLLNLDILMSSPTPADHSFALQNRESGPALWLMVLGPILVSSVPQPSLIPNSSSLVVTLAESPSMICGHSI